jgi:hypothetical protein
MKAANLLSNLLNKMEKKLYNQLMIQYDETLIEKTAMLIEHNFWEIKKGNNSSEIYTVVQHQTNNLNAIAATGRIEYTLDNETTTIIGTGWVGKFDYNGESYKLLVSCYHVFILNDKFLFGDDGKIQEGSLVVNFDGEINSTSKKISKINKIHNYNTVYDIILLEIEEIQNLSFIELLEENIDSVKVSIIGFPSSPKKNIFDVNFEKYFPNVLNQKYGYKRIAFGKLKKIKFV